MGSTTNYHHYHSVVSLLSALYNSRVTHVDQVRRPLGSGSWMAGPLSHSGVVVTTDTGKFLIHKVGYVLYGCKISMSLCQYLTNKNNVSIIAIKAKVGVMGILLSTKCMPSLQVNMT